MRGLQFYDEQLRVLNFQKEHYGFASAFGSGKDGKGKDSKGKEVKEGRQMAQHDHVRNQGHMQQQLELRAFSLAVVWKVWQRRWQAQDWEGFIES